MVHTTRSSAETKKLAEALARKIVSPTTGAERVVALTGQLGSGKTTFVKGFARGLGVTEKILSPTFILMQPFLIPHDRPTARTRRRHNRLWHVDCYRLKNPEELIPLGFKEIIKDPKNIVVVEWAERIKALLPKDATWIRFEHGKHEHERVVTTSLWTLDF